jgi:hypothetical protein
MVVGMAETGRCYDELFTRRKKDVPPGHFGIARPRGNRPLQMERLTLMDRTSPKIAGR